MDKYALIDVATVRTLAHVALMAAYEGYVPSSERILTALESARPREPTILICRAMLLARQERFADCTHLLTGLARDWPKNQTVKSILGFILFTTGEPGWKVLLEAVVADGSDAASVELAKMILAEADGTSAPKKDTAKPIEGRQFIRYA